MTDDLYVVGDRVRLTCRGGGEHAEHRGYRIGMRGTVMRVGTSAHSVFISWDQVSHSEWFAASCIEHFRYTNGSVDDVPEPYAPAALRLMPGHELVPVLETLLSPESSRSQAARARGQMRRAMSERDLFIIARSRP